MKPIVVMIELLTDDPLLDPDAIDVSTIEAVTNMRQAVVRALPGLVSVVAVFPQETAELMMTAHLHAAKESGLDLVKRPPRGYRPPGRR